MRLNFEYRPTSTAYISEPEVVGGSQKIAVGTSECALLKFLGLEDPRPKLRPQKKSAL